MFIKKQVSCSDKGIYIIYLQIEYINIKSLNFHKVPNTFLDIVQFILYMGHNYDKYSFLSDLKLSLFC